MDDPELAVVQPTETERGLRILSLDGGGVRGLSSLIILRHLMKRVNPHNPPKPCEYFDLIAGTSTGGLIAIMLGRLRMSVNDCIEQYKELSDNVFKPKHQMNILGKAKDLWNLDGAFDALALEQATRKVIRDAGEDSKAKLLHDDESSCKVFVLAMRAEVTRPARLRSYSTTFSVEDVKCTIVQAVRATSAASSFFSPVVIEGQKFIDAAVGYNNPIDEVLEEAGQIWGFDDRKIERLVSIGTGVPTIKAFAKSLGQMGKSLVKIAVDTQKAADRFERDAVRPNGLHGLYFRFNSRGMEGIGLEDSKSRGAIIAATNTYLNEYETLQKINAFAALPSAFLTTLEQQRYLRTLRTYDVQTELNATAEPIGTTFSWFRNREEFTSWCQIEGDPILHIVGKPGCGKSVLLAWIMRLLSGTNISFFACKHSEHIRRSPEMILSSLLRQILSQQPTLFRYVVPLSSCNESWTYAQLWESFRAVATSPNNLGVICMIDALDECLEEPRRQFIKDLWSLSDFLSDTNVAGYFRLIITSRNYASLDIPSAIKLNLDQSAEMMEDLESFIGFQVAKLIDRRPEFADMADFIMENLKDRADGMYRLIELVVDELYATSNSSNESLRATLQSVPYDIGELYDSIWERIPERDILRARRIFACILCSFEPLDKSSLGSMIAALQREDFDARAINDLAPLDVTGDIRRLFGPLVSIGDHIEVSHPSVKDHFLLATNDDISIPMPYRVRENETHAMMALTCLRYLNSFPDGTSFEDHPGDDFLCYCLNHFARHVSRANTHSDDLLDQEIRRFFDMCSWNYEWMQSVPQDLLEGSQSAHGDIFNALQFACYYGRPHLVRRLAENEAPMASCQMGVCVTQVLHLVRLALAGLQDECLQETVLLFDRMNFDMSERFQWQQLVKWNRITFETAIDEYDEYMDSAERYDHFTMMWCQRVVHRQTVDRTPQSEKDLRQEISLAFRTLCPFSSKANHNEIAFLSTRTYEYNISVVFSQYLLNTYGPDSVDILLESSSALLEAVGANHEHAVQWLVHMGASLTCRDGKNATVLHLAAKVGNENILRFILSQNCLGINSKDVDGKTPLHYACIRHQGWDDAAVAQPRPPNVSRSKVIALLLKAGAERQARDLKGNTPLQNLSHVFVPEWDDIPKSSDLNWRENDLNEVVNMLMQELSDIAEWDAFGATVLHHASYRWPLSAVQQVLQFLTSFGVSACLLDHLGHSPLHWASIRGFESPEKVIQALCQAGVDPRVRQIHGESALVFSKKYLRSACVKELDLWEKKFDGAADTAFGSSWLRDKFEVDSTKWTPRARLKNFPLVPKNVPIFVTETRTWNEDFTISVPICSQIRHPSMEFGRRLKIVMDSMVGDSSRTLPRDFIHRLAVGHYDLTRQGAFQALREEVLQRPLPRERQEHMLLLNYESDQPLILQDVNYYKPSVTIGDEEEELYSEEVEISSYGILENMDPSMDPVVYWDTISEAGEDEDEGKDEKNWYSLIFLFFFMFIQCLGVLLATGRPEYPLGAPYSGPKGFYKLQMSGRSWDYGHRSDDSYTLCDFTWDVCWLELEHYRKWLGEKARRGSQPHTIIL